ncbi:MAG TPA: iron-containing alcohol dehydrogenase [Polyangiaceae bacterium]|nr:iron-containing alcohol dehydrogenase [Polyangiaceae bacterium]
MTSPTVPPPVPREPHIDHAGLSALRDVLRAAERCRVFVIQGASARHSARLEPELRGLELLHFAEARRHVPRELVERAAQALADFRADTVLSVGGGSATGLGKALRLQHSFYFVAVPTTYAGSELTNLYGVTSSAGKQTGRDWRVVPDVVLYDVELTLGMPPALGVTSLINALAHPISALSTQQLSGDASAAALHAARAAARAIQGLSERPGERASRRAAFEATVLCGRVLGSSPVGVHHKLAHLLGGAFDLDHAGLHSVLLPHSLDELRRQSPQLHAVIAAELGWPDPAASLLQALARAGASTSLAQLGLPEAPFRRLVDEHPELPRQVLEAAHEGRRPEPRTAAPGTAG